MKIKKTLLIVTLLSLLFACNEDLPNNDSYTGTYENGLFITNEGPFQSGSGTLTFIANQGVVVQNAYKNVNNEDLGNIVQSMIFHNDKAYIVVNNSHKIIVVDRITLKKIAVIEGDNIKNPRYIVAKGNKAYVSNWNNPSNATDDFIAVIDLETNTVSNTILVGEGPEDLLIANNQIYVNLQGGWHENNKVAIIDIATENITQTITLQNIPNSIVKDANNNIWVLCGNPNRESDIYGNLVKIVNNQIENTYQIENEKQPNHLVINNNTLYYNLNGKIYATNTTTTQINTTAISGFDGSYYTMNANNNKLYTTNANDYTSEGLLTIYDLNTNVIINTYKTGLIPGSIVFQ